MKAMLFYYNSNYAIDAEIKSNKGVQLRLKDQTLLMQRSSEVRKGDEKKDKLKLVEVLHSKEIQDFINNEYKGYTSSK